MNFDKPFIPWGTLCEVPFPDVDVIKHANLILKLVFNPLRKSRKNRELAILITVL